MFTHLEHEDTFRYLASVLPVMRPGSKFVLSCLPLELEEARAEFLRQSKLDFAYRWAGVRNVTTSVDMMSEIARMAGWQVVRWYAGNEANITHELASPEALGQSTCVLRAPG